MLLSLDFIYMPSADVAADLAYYTDVLGGEVGFAIERFDTCVAEVKLVEGGPRLLLAGHMEGEAPVMVFRVADFEAALGDFESKGAEIEERFGIPPGPCAALRTTGGQRIAVYELTRPETLEAIAGRADFGPAA